MSKLPNTVNEPTLARLTRFIHDDLGQRSVHPPHYTVRELVDELCKFNTSRTLCWTLVGVPAGGAPRKHDPSNGHGGTQSSLSRDLTTDVAMDEMAATQRVFARCAQPVVSQVESALTETTVLQPSPVRPKSVAGSSNMSKDQRLSDWLERLEFEEIKPALDGVSSLLDVHFLVAEGDLTAADLEAQGLPKITVRRFLREVKKVRCEGVETR